MERWRYQEVHVRLWPESAGCGDELRRREWLLRRWSCRRSDERRGHCRGQHGQYDRHPYGWGCQRKILRGRARGKERGHHGATCTNRTPPVICTVIIMSGCGGENVSGCPTPTRPETLAVSITSGVLVGRNKGPVRRSYAFGPVSGVLVVGGSWATTTGPGPPFLGHQHHWSERQRRG